MMLLALAARALPAAAAITPPNTSLATIPVAYFGGTTAPRPAANLEMLSKMRLVMVEKWEGRCWADCLANSTATPPLPCSASCDVEADMLSTLRKVKALNPAISTVFYWNTLLAFPFYKQVGEFADAGALLVDSNTQQPVMLRNDNGMPGIGVYDFGKPAGRQLWLGMVQTLVKTGLVVRKPRAMPPLLPCFSAPVVRFESRNPELRVCPGRNIRRQVGCLRHLERHERHGADGWRLEGVQPLVRRRQRVRGAGLQRREEHHAEGGRELPRP